MAHYIVDDRGLATSYKCSNCGYVFWDIFDDVDSVNPDRCNICGEMINEDENEDVW